MLILYIFNILALLFFIFMANYPFEKCFVHFLGGGGPAKFYVLYTYLNVKMSLPKSENMSFLQMSIN